MLQRTEVSGQGHIVSWMPSGKSFRVHDRDAFSKEILPEYFRSNNFRSFQRNLSVYQFARIWSGPEKGAYCHQNFVRHDRKLCTLIKRHVAPKKEPRDNPENAIAGKNKKLSIDDVVLKNKTEEFYLRMQTMNKEILSCWNDEESRARTTGARNQGSGTLQLANAPPGFLQAALAPPAISKQGQSSTTSSSLLPSSYSSAVVGGLRNTTADVGWTYGTEQQQSAASQTSSILPRGSLSLDSTTSGFLAGYHNELQANMLLSPEEGILDNKEEYSSSSPSNTLRLLQQHLLASHSFSSNNNASSSVPGADDHGRFMMLTAAAGSTELLPTSPGPLSFEDDDPFLLDRLWSQTLKMTISSKNPLVAIRGPRSMGCEQQQQGVTTWGSGHACDGASANVVGATQNFSSRPQPSNSSARNIFTTMGPMVGGGGAITTSSHGGGMFQEQQAIQDHDMRGGRLLPITTMTTITAGGYLDAKGAAYYFGDNNNNNNIRNKGEMMSLFSTTTTRGSNPSAGGSSNTSEGDDSGHHRRHDHQQLLQEEEVNSIPAPSDGSGDGGGKRGIVGSSSSSPSSSAEDEQEDDDEDFSGGGSNTNNNNEPPFEQGNNIINNDRQGGGRGPFRDLW